MVKVFIGGSQSIGELPASVAVRIDNIVEEGFTVLIGNASGADTCVQKYLAEIGYANVLVFCTGACRNNAGGWKTIVVSANAGERGFDFYALIGQMWRASFGDLRGETRIVKSLIQFSRAGAKHRLRK